jgi:hypothetical protein
VVVGERVDDDALERVHLGLGERGVRGGRVPLGADGRAHGALELLAALEGEGHPARGEGGGLVRVRVRVRVLVQ